jgi:hypothetical protein
MSGMQPVSGQSPVLRSLFTPRVTDGAPTTRGGLLASYQGPFRDRVLQLLERRGVIPEGVHAAALAGASGSDLARAVNLMATSGANAAAGSTHGGHGAIAVHDAADEVAFAVDEVAPDRAATAYDDVAHAAHARTNPIFGGLMGRFLEHQGWLPPGTVDDAARAAANADSLVAHLARVLPRA